MGKFCLWVFGAFGALMIFAAENSPSKTASNLSAWVEYFDIVEVSPEWLKSGSADTWGVVVGIIIVVVSLGFVSWSWISRKLSDKPENNKKPTETIKQDTQTHEIRDWNILNAIEWWEQFTGHRKENAEVLEFFSVLRQMARDRAITVWGRANSEYRRPSTYTEPLQEIPREHWGNHDFDTMRYVHAENENMIRDAATPPGSGTVTVGTRYVDLLLTSQEVKEKWPASNSAGVETVEDNQKAVTQKYNLMIEHKEGRRDYQQLDIMSDGSRYWTYRISILKEEGERIDNLKVDLSEIEPRHMNIKGLPQPFHVTHRNTPGESNNPVVRVGNVPRFFDIISIPENLKKPMAVIFANTFPNSPIMPNNEYKLIINVVVDENLILQKQYKLVRNSDQITNYRFIEVH